VYENKEFFFAVDVMVQASTLQASRGDQICDRSIMIASLSKHASRNVGYLLPTLFVA
jgi:hypothetical protein